jgi:hypothetical protein
MSAAGTVSLIAASGAGDTLTRSVSRGRGATTAFGSVAVLSAAREARHDFLAHAHHDSVSAVGRLPNLTWSTVVRIQVEVHNGSGHPMLLSPGQFRLRVRRAGTTVSPYAVGRPAAAVASGETVQTWVSYLAPAEETELRVEYDDPARADPLGFDLSVPALAKHPASAGTGDS